MKEYKREKSLYESQVQDLTKRSQHHDDHLRVVDAWFTQVCPPRPSFLQPSTPTLTPCPVVVAR